MAQHTTTARTLGRFIQSERERQAISQKALAERAGLSRGHVSLIEHGQRVNLQPTTFLKLAAALGVPVSALMLLPTE